MASRVICQYLFDLQGLEEGKSKKRSEVSDCRLDIKRQSEQHDINAPHGADLLDPISNTYQCIKYAYFKILGAVAHLCAARKHAIDLLGK